MTSTLQPSPLTSFSRRDELGPIAMTATELFVLVAPVAAFGALDTPFAAELLLACLPAGAFLLAPPRVMQRVIVPVPFLVFLVWWACSVAWSVDESASMLIVKERTPLVVASLLAASLLPLDRFLRALAHSFRLGLLVTTAILVLDPATRLRPARGDIAELAGWRGAFIHKNVLAIYLVLALAVFLTVDRRGMLRIASIGGVVVLLFGSQSATGLAGALGVTLLWGWLVAIHRANHSRGLRAGVVVLSVVVALVVGSLLVLLLPDLLAFYGKDLTFTGRTDIWSAVSELIAERPWFGHGLGAVFTDPPGQLALQVGRVAGFDVPHPHQGALDTMLALGLIGMVLYLASLLVTVVGAVRLLPVDPPLARMVLLVSFAVVVMSLAESVFLGAPMMFVGVTQVLVLAGLRRAPRRLESAGERPTVPG